MQQADRPMGPHPGFSLIHQLFTHRDTRPGAIAALLGLVAFAVLAWGPRPWVSAPGQFLYLHSITEIIVVAMAGVAFATGWHMHEQKRTVASLVVACGALAIGLLDLAHLMSYQGMPDFVTPNSPHKAIVFWLAALLVAALMFLGYVMIPPVKTVKTSRLRGWLLFANLAFVVGVTSVTLVWPQWLPVTFIDGQGVTPFKVAMEGVVIALHGITLLLLFRGRHQLQDKHARLLAMAVLLSIVTELFFTTYIHVTDLANGLGHLYKVVAYLYLYRIVYLENVRMPFQSLRQAQREITESAHRYQQLLRSAPDGILVTDEQGRICLVNDKVEEMLGYSREELIGQQIEILVPESVREKHRNMRQKYVAAPKGRPMSALPHLEAVCKDGSRLPVDISLNACQLEQGYQVIAFIRDVTAWRDMEAELRHLATHDVLTGLPNRALFSSRLEQEVAQARRHQKRLALMLLDLDNFKQVNDSLGHQQGDQMLILTAERLKACMRQTDLVARLGGDEFAVILTDVKTVEDLSAIAEKILKALAPAYRLGEQEVSGGGSLGISLFPDDGETVEELMANADAAMYHAKSEGRNCFRFYTAELNRQTQENLLIQSRLRLALEQGGLELHYQPQVDSKTGEIPGVEALLRWHDPELGFVSPARFVPLAEAAGLIQALGDWVLQQACRQIRDWLEKGIPTRIAVNLSARQFRQRELVQRVRDLLEEHQVPAHLLELEVTESTLMEDAETAISMLRELDSLGVQLTIDDFGTGYSSLNYLKMFPIRKLKIDRSFVRDVLVDPSDRVIIKAIIGLARNLGLELVAEGVEEQGQLDYLRRHGCFDYQGYFFSKPIPARECEQLLQRSVRSSMVQ